MIKIINFRIYPNSSQEQKLRQVTKWVGVADAGF